MVIQEYLIVDGYNIIFSWDELRRLSETSLESARMKLADLLCNYQGYKKNEVILVFDGYKMKGNPGNVYHYHNIDIVYTKEAQTADQFIELVTAQMGRKCTIRVATSDATEQIIVLGKGAARMSARELKREMEETERLIREECRKNKPGKTNRLFDNLPAELAEQLENLRLHGK